MRSASSDAAHRTASEIRVDEHADANAGALQIADRGLQRRHRRVGRPSGLARDFPFTDRHERALIRADLVNQRQQIRSWVTLDVEFDASTVGLQLRRDLTHIRERDVTGVGAWVNRDAWRSCGQAHCDCLSHAWHRPAARVANRRDLVDVDREPGVAHPRCSFTLPAMSDAQPWISCWSRPSSITRNNGSVPE